MKNCTHIFFRILPVATAFSVLLTASCQREQLENQGHAAELTFTVTLDQPQTKAADAPASGWELLPQEEYQTLPDGDTLWMRSSQERMGDAVRTKANPYTGESASPGEVSLSSSVPLGVVAYKYASAGAAASSWTVFSSPAVTRANHDGSRTGASGKWVPAQRLLWPGEGYVRYFGYAPYGAPGVAVSASSGSAPRIDYTVPAACENQSDLLVTNAASSREYPGLVPAMAINVPFAFEHALTGVRFRVGAGVSIEEISVNDIYSKGSLTLGGSTLSWEPEGTKGSFTLTNPSLKEDPSKTGYYVVEDEHTLLLLPQTLPTGARIVATVNDGYGSRTINAVMDGKVWEPGVMLTYTITTAGFDYTFDVLDNYNNPLRTISLSADDCLHDILEGLKVMSYKNSNISGNTPASWTVQYSSDGGSTYSDTPLSWMILKEGENTSTGGSGSVEGDGRSLALGANLSSNLPTVRVNVGPDLIATLRSADEVGSESAPRDLSLHNIYGEPYSSQTSITSITASGHHTSNSYVVNAPGYYCFPLVFGNSIDATRGDANAVNSGAYNAPNRPVGKIPWFPDANGNKISSPGVLPSSADLSNYDAVVVWQDVKKGFPVLLDDDIEVVSAAEVGSSLPYPYIRFKIGKGPVDIVTQTLEQGYAAGGGILPCNILIALRDKNNISSVSIDGKKLPQILWSWHIWVTPTPHQYTPGGANDDFALRTVKYRKTANSTTDLGDVTFLNCNLGWTPPLYFYGGTAVPARSAKIRFTQENGTSIVVTVTQQAGTPTISDGGTAYSAAFYQFGRKDPFIAGTTMTGGNPRTSYADDYSNFNNERYYRKDYIFNSPSSPHSSPYTFRLGYGQIYGEKYSESVSYHWNILSSNRGTVQKTVFDPSPAGFCVPFYYAFTGFFLGSDYYSNYIAGEGRRHTVDATATGLRDFFIPFGGWISNDQGLLMMALNNPSYASGVWTAYGANFSSTTTNVGMFTQRDNQASLQNNRDTRGNPVRPILEP